MEIPETSKRKIIFGTPVKHVECSDVVYKGKIAPCYTITCDSPMSAMVLRGIFRADNIEVGPIEDCSFTLNILALDSPSIREEAPLERIRQQLREVAAQTTEHCGRMMSPVLETGR